MNFPNFYWCRLQLVRIFWNLFPKQLKRIITKLVPHFYDLRFGQFGFGVYYNSRLSLQGLVQILIPFKGTLRILHTFVLYEIFIPELFLYEIFLHEIFIPAIFLDEIFIPEIILHEIFLHDIFLYEIFIPEIFLLFF